MEEKVSKSLPQTLFSAGWQHGAAGGDHSPSVNAIKWSPLDFLLGWLKEQQKTSHFQTFGPWLYSFPSVN